MTDSLGMAPSADQILALVAEYAAEHHQRPAFDPANPSVPVSGKVFGPEDVRHQPQRIEAAA